MVKSLKILTYRSKYFLGLVFVLFLFAPGYAFADTATSTNLALQPVSNPTDISGLITCTGDVNSLSGKNFCGDLVTSDNESILTQKLAALYPGASVKATDIIKCSIAESFIVGQFGKNECTVTHSDKSSDSYAGGSQYGHIDSVHTDSSGKATAAVSEKADDPVTAAIKTVASTLVSLIAIVILAIANWLVGITGVLLNWVTVKTVFEYAKVFGNTPGLLVAWGILRDIGNIILLFGFVFIGIATILDISNYTAKKALVGLLIFAVALNFSLFAAEAIIDTANVFTSAMYNQATNNDANCVKSGTGTNNASDCAMSDGIAGQIMQTTGLAGLFANGGKNLSKIGDPQVGAPLFVGMALFAIIGAVVMGAAAIMLIIRAIVLTLLIVLSPIGFAGMAIPPLQGLAKTWWKQILSQSFFAPVMFLLMLVSLKIASSFTKGASSINAANGQFGALGAAIGSHDSSAMGIILVFMLVCGFMLASIMLASKMGAMGASFAIKTSAGLTAGTMGFVGRRTIGRAGGAVDHVIKHSEFAQKNPGLARLASMPFSYASKASFDGRSASPIKAGSKALGLDLGKPGKTASHGYHGIVEKAKKEREDFRKDLKATHEQTGMRDEYETQLEEERAKQKELLKEPLRQINEARHRVTAARRKGDEALIAAEIARLDSLVETYNDLTRDTDIKNNDGSIKKAANPIAKKIKELDGKKKAWGKYADTLVSDNYIHALETEAHPHGISAAFHLTAGPEGAHEAVESLKKSAGLSDLQKALKDVEKAADKKGGDDGHHDEEPAHAPTSAAPAAHAPTGGAGHADDHGHGPAH